MHRICAAMVVLCLSGSAIAQDIETVRFWRTIDAVADVDADFEARIELVGTGITDATLAVPATGEVLAFEMAGPNTFVIEQAFFDAAELDALFGTETYTLTVNGGTDSAAIAYAVNANTRPVISSPVDGSIHNSPGFTSIAFSACGVCVGGGDATVAVVEQGNQTLWGPDLLPPATTAWDPGDLIQRKPHILVISNLRSETTALATSGLDAFDFENLFLYSNEIAFKVGDLGIDTAPDGPFQFDVDDANAPVYDPTDAAVVETLAGIDVSYSVDALATGKIVGTGLADLDSNGSLETAFLVKGQVKSKGSPVSHKLKLAIKGDAGTLVLSRVDSIDTNAGTRIGADTTKGRILSVPLPKTVTPTSVAFAEPVDWTLDFTTSTIDGKKLVVSGAQLSLAGGRTIALVGKGRFNSKKGVGVVSLKSEGVDKGVKVSVKNFGVDASGSVISGTLVIRALGQTGTVALPLP